MTRSKDNLDNTDVLPHIATVGELLREARTNQNLEMAPISEKLCIAQKYLRALEDNQYETFPDRVYAYGFLKNYAKELGLNGEELFDQYQKELKRYHARNLPAAKPKMPIPAAKSWVPAIKYIVGGLFLICLVAVSVYFLTYQPPKPLPMKTVVAPVVQETPAPAPEAEEKAKGVKTSEKPIVIKAKKEVWFEIWNDDSLVLNKTLKAGESYTVLPEQEGMTLKTNQADRLTITVGGQAVKKALTKGKMVLDPNALTQR